MSSYLGEMGALKNNTLHLPSGVIPAEKGESIQEHALEAHQLVEGISIQTLRRLLRELGHRFQGGWGEKRIRTYALELQGLEYKNMRDLIRQKGALLDALRTVPRSMRVRLVGLIHRLFPGLPFSEVVRIEFALLKTADSLAAYTDATTLLERIEYISAN